MVVKMGSINHIYKDISAWKVKRTMGYLKVTDDKVYELIIGDWDDYQSGDIIVHMRESIYNKLLKREFEIININAYSTHMFDIYSSTNNKIIPMFNDEIY